MDFTLETQTDAQISAEREKQAQAAKLAERAARVLSGTAGDLTADLFNEGQTPLFNQIRNTNTPKR
jgi:hypothetical protein